MENEQPDDQTSSPPRPRRRVRDTVIMAPPETYESLGLQNMPKAEFEELAAVIAANFGIKVGENKITLVTGRVHPMMEKYGFANHREFLDAIKKDATGQLVSELANRISTNHTAFFREEAHFKFLREHVLPELVQRKGVEKDIRIWCAACASGEEAYTLLFTLLGFFQFDYHNWRAGVLATDISAEALAVAKRGVYNRARLDPIPPHLINSYFQQTDADNFEVKPEFRQEVTFRRLNLMNDIYPFRKPFDIIFCRNVMIYFSRNIRLRLLSRMHDWLAQGGYLFIGHSESLVGPHQGYEYAAPAVYRRSD